jgi:phage tail sheath protein FI
VSVFGGNFGTEKYLPYTVEGFFLNGGQRCIICRVVDADFAGAVAKLEAVEEVSIVYAPNAQATPKLAELLIAHCERMKRFGIFDSLKGQAPSSITKPKASSYAALYYPWIQVKPSGATQTCLVPPGGAIAGLYARTDLERGVHKAPANQPVKGAVDLERAVNDAEQDMLNPLGVNCIRMFPSRGILVWGARTLTNDSEYKYINVRRLLLFLEESIKKGTNWTIFEPNNETTWAKVRLQVENFLMQSWQKGIFMGTKPQEAYFVRCDRSTMTQDDLDNGKLILIVGVAAVKPAEFLLLHIVQSAKK